MFYGGWGYGFSQELYDYVFKAIGAKQRKITTGVDLSYIMDVMVNDYDLIWCESETSHLACFVHYLFRKRAVHPLNQFYRSRKAKIISRFHYPDIKPHLVGFNWRAVMALTYSDRVACVSEYWREEIKKLLPVFKEIMDIKIVHNGIDTSKYAPNPSLKENRTIFYLAATDRRKRLHLLIQAMKYLKDWKLIIGGEHREWEIPIEEDPTIPPEYQDSKTYWDWCHKLSEQYKDQIEWTGFLPEEEKIKMYQRATVFCLSSRIESWAVTPMEAMACGTPAIVTNCGGMPEFVPKRQLLSAMPTPKEIAEKVREASRHPEWGELNREIVKAYDWKEIRKEVQELISDVMTGSTS